jgi:hypothetical protein
MRARRTLGCESIERHRCSEGARTGKPAQTLGPVGAPREHRTSYSGVTDCGELALWTAWTNPLQTAGRCGSYRPFGRRRRRRLQRPALGSDEHDVLLARRAWLATAGGSGSATSAVATRCPGSGLVTARSNWLVPPAHGGVSGLSGRYTGRGLRHFGVRRWQRRGCFDRPGRVSCTASAEAVSVRRRHEPRFAGPASARFGNAGDDNGKRATAAAMRYGCRRGECFEGYEPRCGDRSSRLVVTRPVTRTAGAGIS